MMTLTEVRGKLKEKAESTSAYAVYAQREDGRAWSIKSAVCHSSLRHCSDGVVGLVTLPNHYHWRDKISGTAFMNWLVKDSPWRDAFVTKQWRHGMRCDLELPSNVVMGGIVASRAPHEFPRVIELWYEMTTKCKRMNPALAYICAWMVDYDPHEDEDERIEVGKPAGNCWHASFDWGSVSRVEAQRFVFGDFDNGHLAPPFQEEGDYQGMARLFNNNGTPHEYVEETLDKVFGGTGYVMSVNEFISDVMELQEELGL